MTQEQFDQIEQRLNQLEENIREARNERQGLSEGLSSLNSFANELLDIVMLHQRGLRIMQAENQQDREQFQAQILQIWQYLQTQSGNGREGN